MQYGLPPAGRIESRRNRGMVKKQFHTMATAEKIASDGDWYISLWTADAKVWIQKKTAACTLCQKANEERGRSRKGELPKEAHNACIRELLQEVNVHGRADRHMRLHTNETESRLNTL
jgi:hypothetical protein